MVSTIRGVCLILQPMAIMIAENPANPLSHGLDCRVEEGCRGGAGAADMQQVGGREANGGGGVPSSRVGMGPPPQNPTNINCGGVNYMEGGTRSAPPPINPFQKPPSSIIGEGDTMVRLDPPATIFEGEAEMALVIG